MAEGYLNRSKVKQNEETDPDLKGKLSGKILVEHMSQCKELMRAACFIFK